MRCVAPIPVLRSFDETKAKEFYLEFLGFKLDWEHRFEDGLPLYMQVSLGDCLMHISEHHGDCCPGALVRIGIDAIDAYQRALIAKDYKFMRPGIEDKPWGSRELTVWDPFHNRIVFFAPQKPSALPNQVSGAA